MLWKPFLSHNSRWGMSRVVIQHKRTGIRSGCLATNCHMKNGLVDSLASQKPAEARSGWSSTGCKLWKLTMATCGRGKDWKLKAVRAELLHNPFPTFFRKMKSEAVFRKRFSFSPILFHSLFFIIYKVSFPWTKFLCFCFCFSLHLAICEQKKKVSRKTSSLPYPLKGLRKWVNVKLQCGTKKGGKFLET